MRLRPIPLVGVVITEERIISYPEVVVNACPRTVIIFLRKKVS